MAEIYGYIKLNRSILNWEWYSDINVKTLFLHLLLNANFKDSKWRGFDIKRGQLVTSYGNLSSETGLSVQTVRTCINRLKSTHEITCESTSRFSLITIVKWADYQDLLSDDNKPNNTSSNNQSTINQQTSNKQSTTDEERKESKERKEYKDMFNFEEFWNLYPKKQAKSKAMSSFKNIVKGNKIFELIKADLIRRQDYYDWQKEDGKFIPLPTTYLNQKRWEDEYEINKNQPKQSKQVRQPDIDETETATDEQRERMRAELQQLLKGDGV